MNTNEVRSFLISRGYKEHPVPSYKADTQVFCGSKLIPRAKICESNDENVFWHAEIHDFIIGGHEAPFQSVVFRVFGKVNSSWFQLEIYGINFDKVEEKIDWIEEQLKDMWNNIKRP